MSPRAATRMPAVVLAMGAANPWTGSAARIATTAATAVVVVLAALVLAGVSLAAWSLVRTRSARTVDAADRPREVE